MAIAGKLTFEPEIDDIDGWKFTVPVADELPAAGFKPEFSAYEDPASDPDSVEVVVDRKSSRLQLLSPFSAWDGKDFEEMAALLKAVGKCTTDHISPAGPWLKFRGHLDNISDNMFSGAANSFSKKAGHGINILSGEEMGLSQLARAYKVEGISWVAVGDENYGEGSSREHAAMEPRHLGCRVVIVRGFARIHETNLKKQGVLPLTFADPADYDKVAVDDRISVSGLKELTPGSKLTVTLKHSDGSQESFIANHSMSAQQIEWFKAGSALNMIAAQL